MARPRGLTRAAGTTRRTIIEQRDELPAGLTEHLAHPEPRPLVGAVVAVLLGLGALAGLYAAFTGVGPARLDTAVLSESVEARSGELTTLAVLITEVGNTAAMAVLAGVVGIWSWVRDRRSDAVFVVAAMTGAAAVFRSLKVLLDRERPPALARAVAENNESLPSGHATMSIVVIGSLVVLAWARLGATARLAALGAAALWVGAVGFTRLYLGVHWFSDVLAGWLVGGAWLAVCVALWSWLRRRQLTQQAA
ncbi:phosphatase PAP2 family protein [Pseudonocardia nigra]|uniref:phosphatase PAP2 family protein n=1 Tax=Pseudonocardia nigra TaxID=1921578 RepID=UPI001C5FAD67|nr:phosphatase PAP2 family protein [Pseudonocardia nigra]